MKLYNLLQRSISPPPAQTMPRQFSPRPEMVQEYPVSHSGALRKFMGRGVPVFNSSGMRCVKWFTGGAGIQVTCK